MITKLRWYEARLDVGRLRAAARVTAECPYSETQGWGFQLRERRSDEFLATYVERTERVERTEDPLGRIAEFPVVEYRSVVFRMGLKYPGVELTNPPRSLGDLFTHLSEQMNSTINLSDVQVSVSAWLQSLERRTNCKVTAMRLGGIALSADVSASIHVAGASDVRMATERLVARRRHEIVGATVIWGTSDAEATAELRGPGRATLTAPPTQEAVGILRSTLQDAAHE